MYAHCVTCRGLVSSEDETCRICSTRPVTHSRLTSSTGTVRNLSVEAGTTTVVPPPAVTSNDTLFTTGWAPAAPPRGVGRRRAHVRESDRPAPPAPVRVHEPAPHELSETPTVPAISVRGLNKTFGVGDLEVSAVKSVSFDVFDGEVVLIMGPSGSGKTTLLLMLGAMLRPTAGAVVIGGTSLSITPERRLPKVRATHLGFIFQDFNLLSALTAQENVEIACNLAGITGRKAKERAALLLDRVGLGHRLGHHPNELSGGEKQRVAVARALANDPPLLLADEPTANLDSKNGRDVGELLRRLADEDGRTSLIVTHDERLTEIADRVLWLEDGALKVKPLPLPTVTPREMEHHS